MPNEIDKIRERLEWRTKNMPELCQEDEDIAFLLKKVEALEKTLNDAIASCPQAWL